MRGRFGGELRRLAVFDVLAITALALAVRLIRLDHPPFIDELYHVLAARSWLAEGTLAIAAGEPYTRGRAYTYVVAGLFRLFGESLPVARLPAVFAGAALVGLLFVWVRAEGGRLAAWLAGLAQCFYLYSLYLSQLGRFYTLHALSFWVGAFAAYRLATPSLPRSRMVGLVLVGAPSLILALHLHHLTVIGVIALAVWAAVSAGPRLARWAASSRIRLVWVILAVTTVTGLLVAAGFPNRVGGMWLLFRHADLWASGQRDDLLYYTRMLLRHVGPLWVAFPFLLVITAATRPRAAWFLACLFLVPLALHSIAAWKNPRFVFYAMPAFFALTGIALASALRWGDRRAVEAIRRATGGSVSRLAVHAALAALVVAVVGVTSRRAVGTTYRILTQGAPDRPGPYPRSDWGRAAVVLRSHLDSSDVVLGSGVHALYYFGRVDVELFANHLYGVGGMLPEFTLNWRLGRPVISLPESVARVMQCRPRGVVVIERSQWRQPWAVPVATADYLAGHLTPLPLPDRYHMLAFRWIAAAPATAEQCPELEVPVRVGGAGGRGWSAER